MGLSFLAPLFLAGAAFVAAPFIIHHIRRPEREPLKFSSVLFIPNIPKEVVERRRLQHILLMLMRMLFILLLAFAFTRPFWRARAAVNSEDLPARHLILVDTSYSMGADGQFDRAKKAALDALREVKVNEEVAVAHFGRNLMVDAAFGSPDDPDAGTVANARRAIETLQPSYEDTQYLPALQAAQQLLVGEAQQAMPDEEPTDQPVLHFISDFQRSAMPERHTGWKLSTLITFVPYEIRNESLDNRALTDIAVRRTESGALRVLGKVKNWSKSDADAIEVKLFIAGQESAQDTLDVKAGNASQTSFGFEAVGENTVEGYIELGADGLAADNRRYFTWNPPRRKRVLIVANDRPDVRWPSGWFFERAMPDSEDSPWKVIHTPQDAWLEAMDSPAGKPQVVVIADTGALSQVEGETLRAFVESGGEVFVTLNPETAASPGARALLDSVNVSYAGLRRDTTAQTRFDTLSWLDLDHEVFYPFRGARFNDFSALRFYNYVKLEVEEEAERTRVIARFDDESPAVVSARAGEGRMIVWAFPVALEWTNLPKNARFVPLLYETLAYLSDLREGAAAWTVGERVPRDDLLFNESGLSELQTPSMDAPASTEAMEDATLAAALMLKAPGFFRTRLPGETAWAQVDAVNVDARESDPTPIGLPEFELKMTASTPAESIQPLLSGAGTELPGGFVIHKEYGRWFLLAVFVVIVAESWYMSAIRR